MATFGDFPSDHKATEPSSANSEDQHWERKILQDLAFAAIREQRNSRRWGYVFKGLILLYLFGFFFLMLPNGEKLAESDAHTALVDITGVISSETDASADMVVTGIRDAFKANQAKALILRLNTPGGSPVQSGIINDEIRRLRATRPDFPVYAVVQDICASGGYYIAAGADSIFASPNTITGSIGVFGLLPNMQNFFKNKLGVTFDGVKTAQYADAGAVYRPLSETEKKFFQNGVDRIYEQFKQRVAEGRKKTMAYVDSIAQGRVWSGDDGLQIGLVDKIGTLQDAINSAAKLAKTNNFRLREYPETSGWLERLLSKSSSTNDAGSKIKEQLGAENYRVFKELIRIKEISGSTQARLPFEFFIR